jgi:hypothetical protein|tara:strand:+ start:703 stop:1137 length:435 start_codon:yes stop_codon:yes gene_type:complete
MPTRITHFLHDSTVTGAQTLGTSFDLADVHAHDLQSFLPAFQKTARNYRGIVEGIHIRLTAAGTPTKVTIRVTSDAEGDVILVPDTEATLVAGLTTATTKSVAYSVKLPLFQRLSSPGNGTLYVFAKLDAGTATFAESSLTWME